MFLYRLVAELMCYPKERDTLIVINEHISLLSHSLLLPSTWNLVLALSTHSFFLHFVPSLRSTREVDL